MAPWHNPDLPEPEIESDGTDTCVSIRANGVYLTFSFSSQEEASAFIDQYGNAYQVDGSIEPTRRSRRVR